MVFTCIFPESLYKSVYCGYSFELFWSDEAIQMSTQSVCFYEELDRNIHVHALIWSKKRLTALIGAGVKLAQKFRAK